MAKSFARLIRSRLRGLVRLLVIAALLGGSRCARADTPQPDSCNGSYYWKFRCETVYQGSDDDGPVGHLWAQEQWCATNEPKREEVYSGLQLCRYYQEDTSARDCPLGVGPATEICSNGADDDWDGCVDEECTIGKSPCTCSTACAAASCGAPQQATCKPPYKQDEPEICGNGVDDNCNDEIDEHCDPKGGDGESPPCRGAAGSDPILLYNRSAVTAPFTDFVAEAVVPLELKRTYTSADWSLRGGPVGAFGRGWHHGAEATLTCDADGCTVARGLQRGLRFVEGEVATSLDGVEQWQVYRAPTDPVLGSDHRQLLIRRPGGEWILFLTDGRELRFSSVCDSCGVPDAYCEDPRVGGIARLTSFTDPRGNLVHVSYDRPSGTLLGLSDDLGHSLELRSSSACTNGLGSELRYDGTVVATYSYEGLDLVRAVDADGSVLRSYVYDPAGTGLLLAVQNEAGAAIVEFSYDVQGRAIGLVDPESSVAVEYGTGGLVEVTEYFAGTSTASQRRFDEAGRVQSVSDGCACGPPETYAYEGRALVCTTDALGRSTYRQHDALGRVAYQAEYSGTCPPVGGVPSPARQRWFDQGIAKPVAEGVALDLDVVRSETRYSSVAVSPQQYAGESYDRNPAPQAIDPVGYQCTAAPLPAGSVVCRRIASGYVPTASGPAFERHATFFSHDAKGRLVRTFGPVNLDRASAMDVTPIEERTYWPDDETLARRGRLREVKRYASPGAAPLVTSLDYDAFGVYRSRAPDGGTTTFIRDGRGRVRWTIGPDGARSETRYYDGLLPRVTISPTGAATRFSYDSKGRMSVLEHLASNPDAPGAAPALAWSEHTQHDAAGNAVHAERRDAHGAVTWKVDREFDVHHRVVKEHHPEVPDRFRSSAFEASGFLASATDEEGRTTSFTPDELGRVKAVTRAGLDAAGVPVALAVAQYRYHPNSDVVAEVIDGKRLSTSYEYDDFGRVASVASTNVEAGPSRFTYDARGNLLRREDQFVATTYSYDGLDRVLTAAAASAVDGSSVSYAYRYDEPGAEGRLASVVEPDRTVRYGYDVAGRLKTETIEENGVSVPLVTEYVLDHDGEVAELVYPSGLRLRFDRDAADRDVVAVRNVATGTVHAAGADRVPGGPLAALTFGNGLTLAQTFNLRHEPRTIATGPVALGYGMTPAGDVASISQGASARTFEYDFLDRLTGSPGWLAYGYDGNGNRTGETVNGAVDAYAYRGDRLTMTSAGVYRGCYTDGYSRALPMELISGGATVESCTAAARAAGLRYAGLQFGGYCFGGDTLQYAAAPEAECNMECTASPGQICGGLWRNSVYDAAAVSGDALTFGYDHAGNVSVISPPAPLGSTMYQGCYTDDGLRALPVELMSYGATVETCTAAARAQGLRYAGLQFYGYCFGGDALQYEKVPESECYTPCSADPTQMCGGPWRNSIYGVELPPGPDGYAMCFRHDPLGRMVLAGHAPAGTVSPGAVACTLDSDVTEVVARYKYDARGRRVARWHAATNEWTYVVSDGAGNPLSELARTGDPSSPWRKVRDYVWLDGRALAQLEYPGPAGSGEGYAYYFHLDHIGLPRALTNGAGETVWTASARPYGDVVENVSTDPLSGRTVVTNLRLPGQYDERLLGSVGLQGPYYNGARWYLPSVGRYLELDPIALRGKFNSPFRADWYNYGEENPLRFTDRTGQYSEVCWRKMETDVPGARHCYLRVGGSQGDTTSYWADGITDATPHVTPDNHPDWDAECHPITPPDGPAECVPKRTKFDLCLQMQMMKCGTCKYNMFTNNCCDCVAGAIAACGGHYNGPWPFNYGTGP